MNKQIKDLAVKSGAYLQGGYIEQSNGDYVYSPTARICIADLDLNEFAYLLIKECAELTLDYKGCSYYEGWMDYRDAIKEHFGVK